MSRVDPGTAACMAPGCGWTTSGADRFHEAVQHRKATGHTDVPASLSDLPGDDTGARVAGAFRSFLPGPGSRR